MNCAVDKLSINFGKINFRRVDRTLNNMKQEQKEQIIIQNDYVILKNNELIHLCKIDIHEKLKILNFKIPLSSLINLAYNTLYVYYEGKFTKIVQSSYQDNFNYELFNEGDSELLSDQIISNEIQNSNHNFNNRTSYSKSKYVQRKKRKICLEISFHKPTPCLIWKVINLKCANKICYLSYQDVAHVTCLNNINNVSNQNIMIFETCQGLLVGSILQKLCGRGNLIQVFKSDFPNRTCLDYLQLVKGILSPLSAVNYNKLIFYLHQMSMTQSDATNNQNHPQSLKDLNSNDLSIENNLLGIKPNSKYDREIEEIKAFNVLSKNNTLRSMRSMDCLIIVTKFYPVSIALALIRFLKFSRPFVIHCQYKEPLIECLIKLKDNELAINMQISETWLRNYQVLPERTHPSIEFNAKSGYCLSGISVDPTSI